MDLCLRLRRARCALRFMLADREPLTGRRPRPGRAPPPTLPPQPASQDPERSRRTMAAPRGPRESPEEVSSPVCRDGPHLRRGLGLTPWRHVHHSCYVGVWGPYVTRDGVLLPVNRTVSKGNRTTPSLSRPLPASKSFPGLVRPPPSSGPTRDAQLASHADVSGPDPSPTSSPQPPARPVAAEQDRRSRRPPSGEEAHDVVVTPGAEAGRPRGLGDDLVLVDGRGPVAPTAVPEETGAAASPLTVDRSSSRRSPTPPARSTRVELN